MVTMGVIVIQDTCMATEPLVRMSALKDQIMVSNTTFEQGTIEYDMIQALTYGLS